MLPHLEPIARALDELDDEYYVDFDTSGVPILLLYKQERDRYLLSEFQAGLISTNEYRTGSSRKEVEADLADSLLMNPNLVPIANTKKKMEENAAQIPGQAPGMTGAMPGMPQAMPGMPPEAQPPLDPNTMQGAMAEVQSQAAAAPAGDMAQTTAPVAAEPGIAAPATLSLEQVEKIETKSNQVNKLVDIENKSEIAIERWIEILSRGIERIIERQQRVVLEKSSGLKSRKALMAGTLEIDSILSTDIWNKQFDEDLKPVLSAIVNDSFEAKQERNTLTGIQSKSIPAFDFVKSVDSHLSLIKQINDQIFSEINTIMLKSFLLPEEERRASSFREGIIEMYANKLAKDQTELAESVARSTWNFGHSW